MMPRATTQAERAAGSSIRHEYDVVIVGARCAGAATAMLLARAGLSVLAVDKAGYGTDTRSTHALTRSAVLQLSRWGVLDGVRRAATPRVTSVAYHYGDEAVTIPIRPVGDVDALYAPRRTVLDRLLVDEATRSGAHVRHRTRVRNLRTGRDGRVAGVVLEDGTVVRSQLIVGADGARSGVARHVGAGVEHRAATSTATVFTYAGGLPDDAYRNYLTPGIAAGVIPTNEGQANVWVSAPMDELQRMSPPGPAAFLDRGLRAIDPALAAAVRRGWSGAPYRTFPGLRGFVRRAWGPGWALVGDAVYFKDPISAHGITDALVGAELLARAIRRIADGADEAAALTEYAARRTELAQPMMAPVARLASFRWDLEGAKEALVAVSRAMRTEWDALCALEPLPWTRRAVTTDSTGPSGERQDVSSLQ